MKIAAQTCNLYKQSKPRKLVTSLFQSNQGNIYSSSVLSGYATRPLRETEFHNRIESLDCGHPCGISWTFIPTADAESDDFKITSWPLILPSTLVP